MNHDELIAFLDARAERVSKLASRFDGEDVVSRFPTKWWPGFSGYTPTVETAPSTRWQIFDGRSMWAHIINAPYCAGGTVPVLDRKSLPQFDNLNTDWDSILSCLNNVGRPSGMGEFRRPKGPFIYDVVTDPDGWRLLEAAHAVAHARAIVRHDKPRFLETLAELVLARRWDATFWVPTVKQMAGMDPPDEYGLMSGGIKVAVSVNMRKPWLTMPAVGPDGPKPGEHTIAVLIGIHLEPEPWSTREDNPNPDDKSWLEMNRWSCMPTIVCMSGWKGLDELYKAPLVGRYRNSKREDVCLTLPVSALDPPSALDACVDAIRHVVTDVECETTGRWRLDKFLVSDALKNLLTVTPTLPCRDCLRLNMASPGAPTRPAFRRPDQKKLDKSDSAAEKEWAEYDAKVDKIFEVVDKACEFCDIRFGDGKASRRNRKRNSKKLGELMEKADRIRSKADELRKKMEYSRAKDEGVKLSEVRRKISELVGVCR